MNNNLIQLLNVTPEQLTTLINEGIKEQLTELKESINTPVELMTREQTCEFLQIDSSTLWHWTNKGRVTAYGIGNRRYYKRSELIEALQPLKVRRVNQ